MKRNHLLPLLASVVVLACTVVIVYVVLAAEQGERSTAQTVAGAIADAFRPQDRYTTVISTAIGQLNQEAKLVVLTAPINVDVTKPSERKILWGLNLGTTTVRLRVAGSKVQYVVPLGQLRPGDARYDPRKNILVVSVPHPVLDEDMVDVPSDPAQIEMETDLGWARLDRFSGRFLRKQAMTDLRPAVIEQARSELLHDQAQDRARLILTDRLLTTLGNKLRPELEVKVEFR